MSDAPTLTDLLGAAATDDTPVRYDHECEECGKQFSNVVRESPLCCVCEVKDIRARDWGER